MQTKDELSSVNPADVVSRCATKGCPKSFQGKMPAGWLRLTPDSSRALGECLTAAGRHMFLCPQHAFDAGR